MRLLNIYIKSLILIGLISIVACSSKETEKTSGQVVAKVNDGEISIHQLNFAISHANGINKDNIDAAKSQIINSLVEQELVYQKAVSDKLDRDPDIMMAIEQAKRQAIVQGWVEKTSNLATKPSAEVIDNYYSSHPELFAKHKVFKIKELLIPKIEETKLKVSEMINGNKKLADLQNNLTAEKITFKDNISNIAAENLPLEQLGPLSNLAIGEYINIDEAKVYIILSVLDFKEEPIDKDKARPLIENFLINQQRKSTLDIALKSLKEQAKIQYMGDFKNLNNDKNPVTNSDKDEKIDQKNESEIIKQGIKGL